MEAAIKAVLSSTADSINASARDHGVPVTTLKNRLSGRVVHGTNPGPAPYLNTREEDKFVEYLSEANKMGYGKTRRQVKVIAERVATDKGVLRGARISDGWWRRFLLRHPQPSLQSGDATGYARMNAMNEKNLKVYFDLLDTILKENNLKAHPEQIYNMDESGLPLNPRPPKVLAFRGQKKVRYQCSGSKSQITVLGCCNGTGQVIPPFVMEAKNRKKEKEAAEKEERKRERERKKLEKEKLAKKKKEARLELKKKTEAAFKKKKEATARNAAVASKRRNTRSSSATNSTSLVDLLPDPALTQCETSSTPASVTSVVSTSSLSLPGPSSAIASHENDLSLQENQGFDCECPFCFETYCHDGKEWLECACGCWIHEQCMDEVILDSGGQERFCPFCLN